MLRRRPTTGGGSAVGAPIVPPPLAPVNPGPPCPAGGRARGGHWRPIPSASSRGARVRGIFGAGRATGRVAWGRVAGDPGRCGSSRVAGDPGGAAAPRSSSARERAVPPEDGTGAIGAGVGRRPIPPALSRRARARRATTRRVMRRAAARRTGRPPTGNAASRATPTGRPRSDRAPRRAARRGSIARCLRRPWATRVGRQNPPAPRRTRARERAPTPSRKGANTPCGIGDPARRACASYSRSRSVLPRRAPPRAERSRHHGRPRASPPAPPSPPGVPTPRRPFSRHGAPCGIARHPP